MYTVNCPPFPFPNHLVLTEYLIGCLNLMHMFFLPLWHRFSTLRFKKQLYPQCGKKRTLSLFQKNQSLKTFLKICALSHLPPLYPKFANGLLQTGYLRVKSIGAKIDTRQFGSFKNSSATHALLSLTHHLLSATDASSNAVRVFLLDFEKAFDRIDHNILVNKLQQMSVSQTIINWIRSFLSDRKQRVKLANCHSDWQTLNGGVPQGSVLGPALFLVMINDLLIDWSDRWKYVDDSTFAERVTSTESSELQDLVNVIYNWCEVNNMKLNIGKCKEMVIDFAREKHEFLPLTINNVGIERVKSARILGLSIQDDLKWNEHVNHIVKKAGKRLYMLRLLKRSNADNSILILVYCTIIRPVLEYACQVWHFNITEYLSEDIEKLQKRALRIVLPFATYREACSITGIPLLKDRRRLLCERFFVKNAHGDKLGDLLPPKLEHNYNTRYGSDYNNYSCKTDRFMKSFFPQMVSHMNRP